PPGPPCRPTAGDPPGAWSATSGVEARTAPTSVAVENNAMAAARVRIRVSLPSRNEVRCSGRVSRILSTAGHLRERRRDDHSSRPGIAGELEQPTRRLRTGRPRAPPYLALLRAGFCLPSSLRGMRCALTAPFHPYPPSRRIANAGGIFSVPLSFELPR